MEKILLIALFVVSGSYASAQKAAQPQPVRVEFAMLVAEAIQDIDDMQASDGELAWELDRITARKSATAMIRASQDDREWEVAGEVWDYLQNRITTRMIVVAGQNPSGSRADEDRHRSMALAHAGIPPSRLYPHSKP